MGATHPLNNNTILRKIRDCFDYSDGQLVEIFAHVDQKVTPEQVRNWLRQESETDFIVCEDADLAYFLNALIIEKRGKKEGAQPEVEQVLTNNIILKKLKIAFDLHAEDILEILALADVQISKHELSALFRKSGHKHFRECSATLLQNFLHGVALMYRGDDA